MERRSSPLFVGVVQGEVRTGAALSGWRGTRRQRRSGKKVAMGHTWGHVVQRAQACHRRLVVCVHGQAKVCNLQSAIGGEERVLKLDVAVDDAQGVHVGEALHEGGHDAGDGVSLLHAASHMPQEVKQVALCSVLDDEDDVVRVLKGAELQQPRQVTESLQQLGGTPGMTAAVLAVLKAQPATGGGTPCTWQGWDSIVGCKRHPRIGCPRREAWWKSKQEVQDMQKP